MSLLISHRGNTEGLNPLSENSLPYIQAALDKGFHVVVDVWLIGESHLAIGTDRAMGAIELEFIKENKIICRARTTEALDFLLENAVHCFIHDKDDHALTNGGLIWTAPGKTISTRSVITMPEWTLPDITTLANVPCAGICSNEIQKIKDARDALIEQEKDKEIPHDQREEHICNCFEKKSEHTPTSVETHVDL